MARRCALPGDGVCQWLQQPLGPLGKLAVLFQGLKIRIGTHQILIPLALTRASKSALAALISGLRRLLTLGGILGRSTQHPRKSRLCRQRQRAPAAQVPGLQQILPVRQRRLPVQRHQLDRAAFLADDSCPKRLSRQIARHVMHPVIQQLVVAIAAVLTPSG